MWSSELARSNAIRRMLAGTPGVARLWGEGGPAEEAVLLLEQDGGYLSSGERVLLKAAFDLWSGRGGCRLADLLDTLDEKRLRAVALALLQRDGGVVPLIEEALSP